jgi:hypothetical protein
MNAPLNERFLNERLLNEKERFLKERFLNECFLNESLLSRERLIIAAGHCVCVLAAPSLRTRCHGSKKKAKLKCKGSGAAPEFLGCRVTG